jgi:hypothetical protein
LQTIHYDRLIPKEGFVIRQKMESEKFLDKIVKMYKFWVVEPRVIQIYVEYESKVPHPHIAFKTRFHSAPSSLRADVLRWF